MRLEDLWLAAEASGATPIRTAPRNTARAPARTIVEVTAFRLQWFMRRFYPFLRGLGGLQGTSDSFRPATGRGKRVKMCLASTCSSTSRAARRREGSMATSCLLLEKTRLLWPAPDQNAWCVPADTLDVPAICCEGVRLYRKGVASEPFP